MNGSVPEALLVATAFLCGGFAGYGSAEVPAETVATLLLMGAAVVAVAHRRVQA